MFVIVPEAMEEKPPEAEELLPELAIVDYPRTTYRLNWLYMYYLSWGEFPLPFLDKRSPLTFLKWKRRAFIHFTNMYYTAWMNQYARVVPSWTMYAGRLNALCPDCSKQASCKELCVLALSRQQPAADANLMLRISQFYFKLGVVNERPQSTGRRLQVSAFNIDLWFSEEIIGARPRLKIDRTPPPLVPLPKQEEDEEWE
jgi:hypothetical protein